MAAESGRLCDGDDWGMLPGDSPAASFRNGADTLIAADGAAPHAEPRLDDP